jgi:hypothetical protein
MVTVVTNERFKKLSRKIENYLFGDRWASNIMRQSEVGVPVRHENKIVL